MTPPCDNEGSAAYPEYAELREEAERTCPRFVDPRGLLKDEEMRRRRGYDWCTAVLGRAYSPRAITTVDAHMLKIADERNLDPPLPQSILDARAEAQRREQKRTEQRQAYKERDVAAWADALEQCDVPVHVRPNTRGRRTPGHADGFNDGPLRHAVPDVDAMSGRSRRHPVGRALCETEPREASRAGRADRRAGDVQGLPEARTGNPPRRTVQGVPVLFSAAVRARPGPRPRLWRGRGGR